MQYINLKREIADADRWVTETAASLGDNARAQRALRAVLVAVRDGLPIVEAAKIAGKLPALLRGPYAEGWTLRQPRPPASRAEFLDRVAEGLDGSGINSESAAGPVFRTFDRIVGRVPELDGFQDAARSDKPPEMMAQEFRAADERAALDGAPIPAPQVPDVSMFAESVEQLEEWVRDLMVETGWSSPDQALAALCVVLRVLRDRVNLAQVLHLGTRLPPAIRGFYFEGWDPEKPPADDYFVHAVGDQLGRDVDFKPGEATVAVFHVLSSKVTQESVRDIRKRRRFDTVRSRLRKTRSRSAGKR